MITKSFLFLFLIVHIPYTDRCEISLGVWEELLTQFENMKTPSLAQNNFEQMKINSPPIFVTGGLFFFVTLFGHYYISNF